jgi:replicative DNA helicase
MITAKEILGCMMANKNYKALNRVEGWMFNDAQDKKLLKVLQNSKDRDITKLRELSGVSATYMADMSIIESNISSGSVAIINKDIEEFVDTHFQQLLLKNLKSGGIKNVQKIMSKIQTTDTRSIVERYEQYEKENSQMIRGNIIGFSTGIDKLDKITLGMIKRHIWVCGAYYGYGKTYFMLNMVSSAIDQGKRVLIFSLEMTAEEIIARLIALTASLNTLEVFNPGEKLEQQMDAKEFWLQAVVDGRLVIDDEMRDVDSVVAKVASSNQYDLVCLDYLQLLATGNDQYEALREATKTLQMVTKKYGFTLLLLSQISNQAQREGGSKLDGFKGAGDIGQIANVAMRIEREKNEETGAFSNDFVLNVSKVRHNMAGNIKLKITFPGGRIGEYEYED